MRPLVVVSIGIFILSFATLLVPLPKVYAGTLSFTTTTTSSITGWLFPDGAHLANTMVLVIFPLMGAAVLSTFLIMFKRKGDVGAHAILFGIFLGTVFADLPSGGGNIGLVSFGNIVIILVSWGLYWWNS